ncbi:hypothetical protein HYS49_03005 [Candidatus Woesearchaeota archaeon]|nr:hypothetical protein [Candidatus Woesearchaeota archaeon]
MADPIAQVLQPVDEVIALLQRWKADLLRISDVLEHSIHDVLQNLPGKLSAVTSPKKKRALEKRSLRRMQKKFARQRRFVLDAHDCAEDLRKKVSGLTPRLYAEYSKKLLEFVDKISPYDARWVKELSAKEGELALELQTSPALASVLPVVNRAIDGVLAPLLAEIKMMLQYLEEARPVIEKRLIADATFTVVLDGVSSADETTYLDASFARRLEKERVDERKTLYNIRVSAPLLVPRRVWHEMEHHPHWLGRALVPRRLRDYLEAKGHAQVVAVNPTVEETAAVVSFWQQTPKGRSATEEERERFPKSGDVSLLAVALRPHEKPVVILSNDSDVYQTIKVMRRSGKARDVRVFAYAEESRLEQMA